MMSDKKIKVLDGMLEAAMRASMEAGLPIGPSTELRVVIEAALRWLSAGHMDFPLPLLKEILEAVPGWKLNETVIQNVLHQGLRRMFLAPEPEVPEVPEEIEDLLSFADKEHFAGVVDEGKIPVSVYKAAVTKAFHRGQKSRPA
jgi:hypothetical protein